MAILPHLSRFKICSCLSFDSCMDRKSANRKSPNAIPKGVVKRPVTTTTNLATPSDYDRVRKWSATKSKFNRTYAQLAFETPVVWGSRMFAELENDWQMSPTVISEEKPKKKVSFDLTEHVELALNDPSSPLTPLGVETPSPRRAAMSTALPGFGKNRSKSLTVNYIGLPQEIGSNSTLDKNLPFYTPRVLPSTFTESPLVELDVDFVDATPPLTGDAGYGEDIIIAPDMVGGDLVDKSSFFESGKDKDTPSSIGPSPAGLEAPSSFTPRSSTSSAVSAAGCIIHENDLVIYEIIGKGSVGQVYRGRWRGADVAVKKCDPKHFANMYDEAELLSSIRPHPNIVALYGVCMATGHEAIVEAFYEGGSARSLYKQVTLSFPQKVQILQQAACGVEHLHSQLPHPIIHRDLACRNLLCRKHGGGYHVAVCDFGFSRQVMEDSARSETNVGPVRWMPPEAIIKRIYSKKSDVWSFACMIYELLTEKVPYPDCNVMQVLVKVHSGELILKPKREWSKQMRDVVSGCLMHLPENRFEMHQVRSRLEEMETALERTQSDGFT